MIKASIPPGRFLRLVFVMSLPLCAQAASPEPVDEATLRLDKSVQELKAAVLDINQRALSAEQNFLFPEETRVTVYLGVKISGFLVNDVTVTIDDGVPSVHEFGVLEAIVLQRKGLYRVARLNAAPGAHRIKLEFSGRYSDSKPDVPLLRNRYEAVFEKTQQPSELELTISQEGFRAAPTLKLRDWRVKQ